MNASRRLTLTIVAIFSAVFCVLSIVMFYQARADIYHEERAAMAMAKVLASSQLPTATITSIVRNNRDIRLADAPSTQGVERWLERILNKHPATVTIPSQEGDNITVIANNLPEIDEIKDTLRNVFFIFLMALVITLFTLRYAVNSRLTPLAELCDGLQSLKAGDLKLAAMSTDIVEIHTLREHYNNLINSLSAKEHMVSQLRKRLAALQENERRLLARELHDNLGQLITGISVQSYMLKQQKNNPQYVVKACDSIHVQCTAVHQGMKDITQQLYPVFLTKLGLLNSLQQMTQTWQDIHQIEVRWMIQSVALTADITRDTQIYRFMQEALNNIAKHAKATEVVISFDCDGQILDLRIADNGQGFDVAQPMQQGLGLISMRERSCLIGGTMHIDSSAAGTTVTLRLLCCIEKDENNEHTHC